MRAPLRFSGLRLVMTRPLLSNGVVALTVWLLSSAALGAADDAAREGDRILRQVERANASRAEALAAYHVTRRYAVFEPGHPPNAELIATMDFVAPSSKTFQIAQVRGVGWIERRVFRGLMDAERDAGSGRNQHDSAVSVANYDAVLIGAEPQSGRDCYVLALQPRRGDKYLFRGKVWVDKEDLAIVHVAGEPARNPSFWITHAAVERDYQRIGSFWLPLQDETHTQVRFAGEYVLRIEYSDYRITPRQ